MAEVINISDDEVVEFEEISKEPKQKTFKCLNTECRSETNLIKATINVRRFYSVLPYPKKTRVCAKCAAFAKVHSDNLIDSVRNGKLILSLVHSQQKNTVVLSDSDSDLTDNEPDSGESEVEYDPDELYGNGTINTESMNCNRNDGYDEHDPQERIRELIGNISNDLKLKDQIEEGARNVSTRLNAAETGFQSLNDEYRKIEASLDDLRSSFYESFRQEIQFLPPIEIGPTVSCIPNLPDCSAEIIAEQSFINPQKNLPPIGTLERPDLAVYDKIYSIKYSLFARWVEASVMGIEKKESGNKLYKICYSRNTYAEKILGRTIPGKHLAYYDPCKTRIPVGTRIIARYKDEDQKPMEGGSFYVGIIAEIPTGANKFRYLIFFDDGYAQYVTHNDVRVVVETSSLPFEDVASDSREFIKDYLHTYPERPMVRLQKTNLIKTEWNGRWWKAQVLEVDASLVKMFFPMDGRTEWIYRGSTRLSPLFNKKMNIQSKAEQNNKTIRRRTLPYNKTAPVVEYVNMAQEQEQAPAPSVPVEIRAVARKSTSGRPGTPPQEVQEQIYQESRGFIRKRPIQATTLAKFAPHQCSKTCDLFTETSEDIVSPLLKPILRNWRRQISKERKKTVSRNIVAYVAPCGRRLRSMEEVFRFLRLVESDLEIDFFTFDIAIDPTNDWEPAKKNIYIPDISNGIENIPISCVNSLDKFPPSPLIYCNVRQPTENVNLNLDPSFLVHCNCTDDCQDKSRCECWQLTAEGTKYLGLGEDADIGYKFRRLHESVTTGIYECNPLCSCKNTCLNRVVQHPIKQKLQLFKTARRGWGVRTLHDIPQGAFICVYVGRVLNEAVANMEGKMTTGGDDYYAELDFIEVVEGMKEGYESEVEDEEDDEGNSNIKNMSKIRISTVGTTDNGPEMANANDDDDTEFRISSGGDKPPLDQREPSARLQARSKRSGSSNSSANGSGNNSGTSTPDRDMDEEEDGNDEQQRRPQTFEPKRIKPPKQYNTARELYGEDEKVYIMDAKVEGNIGRYFNHSCQPNIFVQNVFVDTHDVRFPWVAFFASMRIRAGIELTWDYNYEVGSVPGKIKYCYCNTKRCRGRLL